MERYRIEALHRPEVLRMSSWLVDYPFADRLYPRALDAVKHVQRWGPAVILSDGDAVFQPRKLERSGLWRAFEDRVLIYIHKEEELDDVERFYPAKHYVMLRILDAMKNIWGKRVTTVVPKQGHYANDQQVFASYPPADIQLDQIGDLQLRAVCTPEVTEGEKPRAFVCVPQDRCLVSVSNSIAIPALVRMFAVALIRCWPAARVDRGAAP